MSDVRSVQSIDASDVRKLYIDRCSDVRSCTSIDAQTYVVYIDRCSDVRSCTSIDAQTYMKVTNQTGTWVPLYVMTSEINDSMTREFFEEHDYFGYNKDYVKFFVQEMVPAVDFDGNLLMKSEDSLAMSPNGNGGWFKSLINAGLDKDLKDKGVEWLNVFAVDNVLQQIADPVFVGATIESGCVSGSKVVRSAIHTRESALCVLRMANLRLSSITSLHLRWQRQRTRMVHCSMALALS